MSERPLEVLVVDDSAVVRQTLAAILKRDGGMRVTTAADPLFAMQKMETLRPDVIVLDLEMPRLDGLTWLRQLMARSPLPVVVCSALSGRFASSAIQALEAGAVDVIRKPQLGTRSFLEESAAMIVDTVQAAARARLRRMPRPTAAPPRGAAAAAPDGLVAVGASTGGTEALRALLGGLPADGPPLAIVQHMPEGFTRAFAERLNGLCRIRVKEAQDGDTVLRGQALIAPGNRHMMLKRSGARYFVEIKDGPLVCRHRPSVDVLFRSTARYAGKNAIGIIMTGMGDDGARGLLAMRRVGARTLAQDDATSAVYGMPKAAIALGAAEQVLPLARLAATVLRLVVVRSPPRP
jgi:two-component system chemotaxis response regulator CheB